MEISFLKIRVLNECSTKNALLRMNDLNKFKTQRKCAKHLKFFNGPIKEQLTC